MRRRTLIGVADPIRVTMEEKCGGAAESKVKTNLVANFQSTSAKKMMMKKMMTMTKRRTKQDS